MLVAAALIIAAPLAYFGLRRWLDNFAYRIPIGPAPFVLAGVAALGLALIAVSFHAVRAAAANPADTLRSD